MNLRWKICVSDGCSLPLCKNNKPVETVFVFFAVVVLFFCGGVLCENKIKNTSD